ncbi:MAG: nucleotidyltransferase domain-containing protein [Acetivibrio sp.]
MNTNQMLLMKYVNEVQKIYGSHLKKVILYGSFARGDNNENSDIDIMILVDLSEEEIKNYSEKLSEVTFDMNLDNDIMIMPIVKNEIHFEYWLEVYPFYINIKNEGVSLYAA